jgi:hypothetical protein
LYDDYIEIEDLAVPLAAAPPASDDSDASEYQIIEETAVPLSNAPMPKTGLNNVTDILSAGLVLSALTTAAVYARLRRLNEK